MAMKKAELLKHLQRVAQGATPRKAFNSIHVRAIVDETLDVWTQSLRETGTASFHGLGRFTVDKKTGDIKFKASSLLLDKLSGDVSSSAKDRRDSDDEA
ncbi:hypothetical protein BBJ28_00002325 [Nothophytophthora sp. Chile5]|nr:hypothetical protein BBJ28_00002325 [Nothophytophthora sp. Chile5]